MQRSPLFLLRVQPREHLRKRGRTQQTSRGAPPDELVRETRPPGVGGGALERFEHRRHLAPHRRHPPDREVADVQSHVIARRLEHRQRLLDERRQLTYDAYIDGIKKKLKQEGQITVYKDTINDIFAKSERAPQQPEE